MSRTPLQGRPNTFIKTICATDLPGISGNGARNTGAKC
jgi:hypothetical protein